MADAVLPPSALAICAFSVLFVALESFDSPVEVHVSMLLVAGGCSGTLLLMLQVDWITLTLSQAHIPLIMMSTGAVMGSHQPRVLQVRPKDGKESLFFYAARHMSRDNLPFFYITRHMFEGKATFLVL
jgi:hypothetical protein